MIVGVDGKTCMTRICTTKRLTFYHGANTCSVFLAMLVWNNTWNAHLKYPCKNWFTPAYTNTEWMKTTKNRRQPTVVYRDIFLGVSHSPYHKYCQDARSTKGDTWELQTGSSHSSNSRYFNSVISISSYFLFIFRVIALPADEFIQWSMKEWPISE